MSECLVVETSLGRVKGKLLAKVEGGKDVYRYSSLPFAKPPLGDLRLQPPASPDPWDGILDATKHSAAPIQNADGMKEIGEFMPDIVGEDPITYDEDCLYLSVYSRNPSKAANLPVLFWIYGGGFTWGGEIFYDARVIASLHDVVVVVPNYRLSVFGFLSLGKDTISPGNIGLHDQIMALKWTQNHIESFGGNPENVTIFGESAGAYSVSFHVMSPLSTGLFHRAISHSGSFFAMGIPSESGDRPLNALLKNMKITEKDPKVLFEKVKSMPAKELLAVTNAMEENFVHFGPVYDGEIFPKKLSTMKKEPIVNNVPYIVGCNSTEGHGIMTVRGPKGFKDGITKESYEHMLKYFVGASFFPGLPDAGFDVITKHYEKGKKEDDKKKWSKMYGEILADILFIIPTIKALKQHVESKGKSYMYVMTQKPEYNHSGPEKARKADFCECDHGDDVAFTFGMALTHQKLSFDAKFTDDEKKLTREWMNYLVNFATNGDPNIGNPVKVKWPEYDVEKREYLSVQEPCSNEKNFGEENFEFWKDVVEPMCTTTDQSPSK